MLQDLKPVSATAQTDADQCLHMKSLQAEVTTPLSECP